MSPRVKTPLISRTPKTRIGGRGYPLCGSHDTERFHNAGAQWCNCCNHKWVPCQPHCRGYSVDLDYGPPFIRGCDDCGVPDRIAQRWPEGYRSVSFALAGKKLDPID
jgi:hypothetical protein